MNKKTLLLILDGWGVGENIDHNAITLANPKYWDELWNKFPHSILDAKEEAVGLPKGCLSGSEVGHLTLGSGRIIWQGAARIERSLQTGEFFTNQILINAEEHIKKFSGKVHLIGLLSDGGIHSHYSHLLGFIDWAKNNNFEVCLHMYLDGRDMAPKSALGLLEEFIFPHLTNKIKISTICGRATAMDRSENWDRSVTTHHMLTKVNEIENKSVRQILEENYAENITDEFVQPTRFDNRTIENNDVVIFFNFRADRMRQTVRLFTNRAPKTVQDDVIVPNNLYLVSMTEYDADFKETWVLFPPDYPKNTLGEWISTQGLRQFRIAETEKYAHVTYFFNGGQEQAFPGEERLVIPSLGLTNYASNPEMSLDEVTASLERVLDKQKYDLIVCNLANGDMVGHSGDLQAGIEAVKKVDEALMKIIPACERNNYTAVITADHGNIEKMKEKDAPHTAHTFNDVPLVITDESLTIPEKGSLYQVAPTILKIMGVERPDEMTGESLIEGI